MWKGWLVMTKPQRITINSAAVQRFFLACFMKYFLFYGTFAGWSLDTVLAATGKL